MVLTYIFYVLIIQQILQGVYSLWDGWNWLRMARQRLASHSGFYAPQVAVICPCKGLDIGLEDNLLALTRFDHPTYEILIPIATSLDPALKIIERVKAASKHKLHVIVAGPPDGCGEKVSNLRKAVENIPDTFEVFVFTDSDTRLGSHWLSKMVAPLGDPRLGATTTYRWSVPTARKGKSSFWSAIASVWNASIVTMLGKPDRTFCWGGGTAIRRQTFIDTGVLEFWKGSVSDDLSLTQALRMAGRSIIFLPECLAPTPVAITASELLEFTNRQLQISRVYDKKTFEVGAGAHASYCITLLFGAVVMLVNILNGDPWDQLAFLWCMIPLLAAFKGAIRTLAAWDLLPEWKGRMKDSSWAWIVLAPGISFLFLANSIVAVCSRVIRWRGIRYQLVSETQTVILNR